MKAIKKPLLYFANYLIIFLLIISCQEKEDISPEREYPRVKTGVITKIDEIGISVTGEILSLGNSPVLEHGFIWSVKPKGEVHNSEKVSLGAISKTGTYSTDITFALEKDKEYSIKAYAKTEKLTVYGQEIAFTSQGSLPPVITDFNPKTGTWGDTITVIGKNFAISSAVAQVTLSGQKADIFSTSSTSFKFVIPTTVSALNNFIGISVYGASSTSAAPFILKQPRVFSSARTNGWLGDTLTIIGEFLGPDPRSYSVYFNQTGTSKLVSASYNQIKVIVPDAVMSEVSEISIKNKYYTLKSPQQFTLDNSKITSVTPSDVTFATHLIIEGKNFHATSNHVFLGNSISPIHVTATNYNKISFRLDKYDIIPARTFDVSLSVLGRKAEGKGTITIKEKWLRQTDESNTTDSPDNILTLNDKLYIVQERLSEFNPSTNKWVNLSTIPYTHKSRTATFTLDNKIFVGAGSSNSQARNDFWQYDLDLNQWKKLADFPGATTLYTGGFTLNGEGYFLTGAKTGNFWKYNLQENKWEKLPDLPVFNFLGSQGRINPFVRNGIIFVVRTLNYKEEFWEFNPTTSTWAQKSNPPQGLNTTLNGNVGPYLLPGTEDISLIGTNKKYTYNYLQDKWAEDLNFTQDFSGLAIKYGFFTSDFLYIYVSSATGNIGLYKTER